MQAQQENQETKQACPFPRGPGWARCGQPNTPLVYRSVQILRYYQVCTTIPRYATRQTLVD